ncbi:MAG TPA: two-component regulator propeller domain-containing protein [Verrucomicrobiae bacterium]|nr:two-component regulator propeller domain-containing protein [Verrucomicrobiae bacterium]
MITSRTFPLRRLVLIGLGLLLSAPLLFALDPSRSLFEYNIQTWNRQNGLPFNRIGALTQTDDGFLWIGTQNGLARFDGIDITHITIPHRSGWYNKSVFCLANSPRGGLWFGLNSSAFGYFDGTNRFEPPPGEGPASQVNVRGIAEDPDGTLWIAGQNGLVTLANGKTNQLLPADKFGNVQTMYKDSQHRVWVGVFDKGLFYLQNGKVNEFPDQSLAGANIRAVTIDHEGHLWVGTSWGLRCFDRDFKRIDPFTLSTEIQALLTDSHGTVWVGTTGNGLIRYVNGETSTLRKTNGLAEDYVSSLCEDREGNLWVGTRDGLTEISDLKFPTASTATDPLNSPVHCVSTGRNGGIWCATSAGIYNYKDKNASYLLQPTNSNLYCKRVLEARNGDIYALSAAREIRIFSHGQIIADHRNKEWPTALAEDDHGVIVAVGGGLFRVTPKKVTPFVSREPLPDFHWIRNLFTCADNSLLVATVDGLYRVHEDRIDHWSTAEGVADQDIICAIEDNEGTLWLGGIAGLTRIRNNKASVIHLAAAEPSINAIVSDDLGNLWLSCSSGIIRASRRELNGFADGRITHVDAKLYDGFDALKTIDLTDVESVGCKTPDGRVWFGGPLGAVEIDPGHIPTDPVPPMVYIQKVLVNGVQESGPHAVSERRGNGELAFQYTAVSFVAPQKIRFRYKLEGYDQNWVEAGSQRYALYANLHPGSYRFEVRACNVDGIWNTGSATFDVELPPLFYQTVWFKLAIGGFALLCLAGVYTWRTRHLREKEKSLQAANESLESRIQERTKELVEGRNLLRIMIDNLPDSVFVKDTEGRVIIDNLAHARYLGFENPSQSKGKSDFDCFPKEKAEEFRRPELRLLESGKEYNAEENLTLKNGEVRWMLTTKVPLRDAHGKITGLAGINRDITERKKWESELENLHKQLLETSRQAGMAEVATSVLHNVGNVLNSVNVSASIVDEQIRAPSLERLQKAIELLKNNRAHLTEFLQDKNGAKVVSYLEALFTVMEKERATIRSEAKTLSKNIEHIKKIVSMQQSYARIAGISEIVNPVEILEDSLRLHEVAYQRHFIKVVREFVEVPKISVDRHKVIQILVNLLSNAKYACDTNDPANRIVRLRVYAPAANRIRIEVIDNGMGIPAENLTRIFAYGFTTRKNGHGFGLHSGALAAREMGGSLTVNSDGPGKGAAFVLELPLEDKLTRRPARDQAKELAPV